MYLNSHRFTTAETGNLPDHDWFRNTLLEIRFHKSIRKIGETTVFRRAKVDGWLDVIYLLPWKHRMTSELQLEINKSPRWSSLYPQSTAKNVGKPYHNRWKINPFFYLKEEVYRRCKTLFVPFPL